MNQQYITPCWQDVAERYAKENDALEQLESSKRMPHVTAGSPKITQTRQREVYAVKFLDDCRL
jgi:cytochrome c551/c552